MEIELTRKNDGYLFEAKNESGNTVMIDASPAIGGSGGGARPMEVVIMALGGCSSIDIVNILKKQRQEITSFQVKIHAERREGETPSLFKSIHVDYYIGGVDSDKAQRAADLSIEKYCSVSKLLEPTVKITYAVHSV
ncbi:MAG TPA: OsmC family protein [Leptospiraceae bacterium]|jgi:putative redox protein|nr:OsmC family protein [Leptospirales bacterium]HMW58458.1 OsmC family protein [Leptospiraceae bacterium]HMX55018.1 OsmC family protein [Leptospiraceae bacterium]HMZ36701.1 OsmC family protein [Leptospiraceae bacterium]HNE23316.1 OsmC family protein [Leptospiraceae bacterium]